MALRCVDLDPLKKYGYKFNLDENLCYILVKCFSDSVAEDGMIAERLARCLTMEDSGHVKTRSILDPITNPRIEKNPCIFQF